MIKQNYNSIFHYLTNRFGNIAVGIFVFICSVLGFCFLCLSKNTQSTEIIYAQIAIGAALFAATLVHTLTAGNIPTSRNKLNEKVGLFFLYLCLNIYYSEIRHASMLFAGYAFSAFVFYYLAKTYFSQNIRIFVGLTIGALIFLCFFPGTTNVGQYDRLYVYTLLIFWGLALPFCLMRTITAVHFVTYFTTTLILVSLIFLPTIFGYFSKLSDLAQQNSLYSIISPHQILFSIIQKFPIFGCGIGTSAYLYQSYTSISPADQTITESGLAFFAEIGLMGFAILVSILVSVFFTAMYSLRRYTMSWHRLWIFATLMSVVTCISLLIFTNCFTPLFLLVLFSFLGMFASAVEPDISIHKSATSMPHQQDNMTIFSSCKLGIKLALIFLITVAVVFPGISQSQLETVSKQTPSVATVDHLRRMNMRYPINEFAWFELAKHIQAIGSPGTAAHSDTLQSARECLFKATTLNPYVPEFHIKYAQNVSRDSGKDTLFSALLNGVGNNPNNTTLRLMLSRELALRGNNSTALENAKYSQFNDSASRPELLVILSDYMSRETILPASLRYLQYALQNTPAPKLNRNKLTELAARTKLPLQTMTENLN